MSKILTSLSPRFRICTIWVENIVLDEIRYCRKLRKDDKSAEGWGVNAE